MEKVQEKTHAELGPSGWDRWSRCPGSVHLTRGMPRKASYYAAEGTVAHEIADRCLSEGHTPYRFVGEMFQADGYDIVVDDEMADAVNSYLLTVQEFIAPEDVLFPEQQVPIGHLTGEPGAEGTSDCIGIVNGGKRLVVIDLKYGKGVRVNAEGNGQGKLYALGAMKKFEAILEDVEEVEIVIVMPRLENGVTSEILNIGEMEEFADEVELAAGRVAMCATDPELIPGEKQCKFCDAKGICPALRAEVSSSLQQVAAATVEDFADLTLPKQAARVNIPEVPSDKLAEFLRAVPLIEDAIAGVRAEVERRLFAGEEVPGFYLGEGRKGNRQWSDEDAVEKILKRELKAAGAYVKKLISPAQAEKKLGTKSKVKARLDKLTVQADGKPSVCREGDKNPKYQISTAEDFADLSVQSEAERLLS